MMQPYRIVTTFCLAFFFCLGSSLAQEVRMVRDINPDGSSLSSGNSKYLTPVGDQLFFVANDGVHGRELWSSDGTTDGTIMVLDINPGEGDSEIHGLIEHNGLCYFFADDGTHGKEVWVSDGTAIGTFMVHDICDGACNVTFADFEHLTSFNGSLYFEGYDGTDAYVWEIDSDNNARLLPGLPDANFHSGITGVYAMNDALYFFRQLSFDGLVLYSYDGSAMTEIEALGQGNIITHQHDSNGIMYYGVQVGFSDRLYAYDSASSTNKLFVSPGNTIHSAIAYDSKLIFSIDDDASLYALSFAADEAEELSTSEWFLADEPTAFVIFNDYIYCYAETTNDGIHRTDGTLEGTELLFDINQISFDRNGIHPFRDRLLIAGEESFSTGEELFVSDGESSLELLIDINTGSADSEPDGFFTVGEDKVFFTAVTDDAGRELWVYEPDAVSTVDLLSNSFNVSPTLAENMISISSEGEFDLQDVQVVICDNSGKVVLKNTLNQMQRVEVESWLPGIYYITFEHKGRRATINFVKI